MLNIVEILDDSNSSKSVAGNYHGDIFESMLDYAKESELNKTPIPVYYEKYMKTII